jgi:hypothetical protein
MNDRFDPFRVLRELLGEIANGSHLSFLLNCSNYLAGTSS